MERKSLYDLSWQVSEEEYRADPTYSYSTIARFNKEGFDNLNKLYDKLETPSLLFGSMVDTLLTDGQEEFDRRFEVAQFPDIPDSIIKIVKDVFREFSLTHKRLEDIPDSEIIFRAISANYQSNWKPETRAKVIKEKGSNYYQLLYLSTNKTLVNQNDYQDACECVDILRSHEYTKKYFEPNNPFNTDIEKFYQLKFKGDWEGIPLRGMMDLIIVDHKNKLIIPCDLKTSGKKEWNFFKSFIEFEYWIQAQLYWYLINQNISQDPFYKDYKLLNFRFIVINRYNKMPLVWEYNDTQTIVDLYYGKNKQIFCRNWRNILEELDYYLTNKPSYPIGIKEVNDIIKYLNNE